MRIVIASIGLWIIANVAAAQSLGDLATVRNDLQSHRESSFDRSGGNGDAIGDFGGWQKKVILEASGPGRISHIWLTASSFAKHDTYMRDLVIRMYWDGSDVPSVEVPVGDFFGLGHAKQYAFVSMPVAVGGNVRAVNCYWPMPFHKGARIELYNNSPRAIRSIYYHVDYELGPQDEKQGLFHAAYHRDRELYGQDVEAPNLEGKGNYVLLDTQGSGQYVGCFLYVDSKRGGWWGEGDDMMFIDDAEKPTINGTGSEDYFNNAWGFGATYNYPFYGCTLLDKRPDGGMFTSVYRFHIPDPVRFAKHIRVTLEHDWPMKIANDFTSVAFWYQSEPNKSHEPLPKWKDNWPKKYPSTRPAPARFEVNATELEGDVPNATGHQGAPEGGSFRDGWLLIPGAEKGIAIAVPVPADGDYTVRVQPADSAFDGPVQMGLSADNLKTIEPTKGGERRPYVDLGETHSADGKVTVYVSGKSLGIHAFQLQRK